MKSLFIEQTDGSFVRVNQLSIAKIEVFRHYLKNLADEMTDEAYKDEELTIAKSYATRPKFKLFVEDIMQLAGLDINRLSAETCYNVLFPHENEDGSYNRQGLLASFWLGEIKGETDQASKADVDHYAELLGKLVAMFSSFKEAMALLESLNYDQLLAMMDARAEALKSPEERAKTTALANAKAAALEFAKSGSSLEIGEEIDFSSL